MSHQSDLIATDIAAYLQQHEEKQLLRLLTCGSVDDGKSTLIGRLLHDSKMVYEDHMEALNRDNARVGNAGEALDLALLVDGLQAEREQGITIDVAYRYFSTATRKFIIADTPGHEQYTRNMATGASTSDLAIILIDARHGVMTQTRRHSFIVSLLGIRHVVVAINKMDLVDYDQATYERIKADYEDFVTQLDLRDISFVPIAALHGDNVVSASDNMPWYQGKPLMETLETIDVTETDLDDSFRFPVQYVNRPNLDFRGYCGTIAAGSVHVGDEVHVVASGKSSRVKSIVTYDGDLQEACQPQAVTLTLEDEIDISRGDMLVKGRGNQPANQDRFDAMLVWMHESGLIPGKQYDIKLASSTVSGHVATIRYKVDVNSLDHQQGPTLELNEIARCELQLDRAVAFDDYKACKGTGSFIVIDRLTNATVAAGMVVEPYNKLWEAQPPVDHIQKPASRISQQEREQRFGQKAVTVLFTGLNGAGKRSIAYGVERALFDIGRNATVLDGLAMRLGMSRDLGFTEEDRAENMRRSAEMAKLLNKAGMICLCPFITPNDDTRNHAAEVVGKEQFVLIHVDAPLEVCKERDPDGFFAALEAGDKTYDIPIYQRPKSPDLYLNTTEQGIDVSVKQVIALLQQRQVI